ncbi:MAG: amylo-alpha-1,6-glucosidase [Methanosarcinaceae archaeon]|nr:amylo-alpha-1,6-glucosidase [Methanosarcinaceae archaeon]
MSRNRLGLEAFSSYERGIEKEWLVENGLGGYASSSIIGANSRTYHGLLVAGFREPLGRTLLFSSLDEELSQEGGVFRLATHRYPGTVHPTGFQYLEKFTLAPFPTWTFQAGPFTIKKKLFLVHGKNTTILLYEITGREEDNTGEKTSSPSRIRLYPLVNARSFHSTTHSKDLVFSEKPLKNGVKLESSNGFSFMLFSDLDFHPAPMWYYDFEYDMERKRGLSFREDNYNPGFYETKLKAGTLRFFVAASTEDLSSLSLEEAEDLYTKAVYRKNLLAFNSKLSDPFALALLRATDPFIVRRPGIGRKTVIAGYPWFSDWGRDAMIALPGLCLIPRRFEDAKAILTTFATYSKNGLIPNRFPDIVVEPDYNTVDASLWFVHALGRYYAYTKDIDFLKIVWKSLEAIIENYRKGTDFGIKMDSDCLIRQGPQLTWMDAKIGDRAVTPRAGKACEINALWYNTLKTASTLGNLLGKDTSVFDSLVEKAAENFEPLFWNPEENCLFDYVYEDGEGKLIKDPAIRPNQILAVSLPNTLLSTEKEKAIVDRVERELLTPFGLRTLSRAHPDYRGSYRGSPEERDLAYHNGTVWPWLLGPFVSAYMKVNSPSKKSRADMRALLLGFDKHLEDAGMGSISEVFDGDFPYTPGGCIAQAWSVSEVLRAYVEDVLGIKP